MSPRARRTVTLPPFARGESAVDFAIAAQERGAQVLEIRTDLHDERERVDQLASILDVLVAQRGKPFPELWLAAASWVDVPLGEPRPDGVRLVLSHHADAPMSSDEAVALWERTEVPEDALIKHVEPLGAVEEGARLLETQRRLLERYGARVTVLATGKLALPFRCVLSERNAFDYVTVDPRFVAAPGQRLLEDAAREERAAPGALRRAIIGHRIAHSRSPRIHTQPFDRWELPADAPVGALVDALADHYAGFAITSPFKKPLARHIGSELEAINTLYRQGGRWVGANTDVEGAAAVLEALGAQQVTVLGEGGATAALKIAASQKGIGLDVLRRTDAPRDVQTDAFVWTWPPGVDAPDWLKLSGRRVAVIAYGVPARRVAQQVEKLGGVPVRMGAKWFVAQARKQRALWEDGR